MPTSPSDIRRYQKQENVSPSEQHKPTHGGYPSPVNNPDREPYAFENKARKSARLAAELLANKRARQAGKSGRP